ncbi:MAG: NlpC/P60 family protein [Bacteroidales bacterium]|jgi:lipoprotein Spr|nr:NlpC/P60 family protein [Bacteroidales bacterium]
MRKKYLLFYFLTICIVFFFCSCSSTKRTSHYNRNHSSYSHKRPNNNNSNNSTVFADSKQYLKEHSTKLTNYCSSWIGTPHVMGGMSKDGVDCSGFVWNVYNDVFNINLPRTSQDMEKAVEIIDNQEDLKEGDLVFFNGGSGNKVNHVGIFINKDKFVHASSSKGVIVSSLNEKYWKNLYRSGGHHPKMKNKKRK